MIYLIFKDLQTRVVQNHFASPIKSSNLQKMNLHFWKYQGAGNDFVMIDQRAHAWITRTDTARVAWLCDRRFGIGADGLILLQECPDYDFEMVYFNADGRESTLCGNGGRCIAAFAKQLGMARERYHFHAIDGAHEATVIERSANDCWVELKMGDVRQVEQAGDDVFILNTGSPHYVRFVEDLGKKNMVEEGRAVRYSDRFKAAGINVNLVSASPLIREGVRSSLDIRTYERGVEDETLACGTGVTAAAIAHYLHSGMTSEYAEILLRAQGGELAVRFRVHGDGTFSEIWLCGPATRVFEGDIELPTS